jgi:hypothetical protein
MQALAAARVAAARAELAAVGARLEQARDRAPAVFSWTKATKALIGARGRAVEQLKGIPTDAHREATRLIDRDVADLAAALGIPESRVSSTRPGPGGAPPERPVRVTVDRGALFAAMEAAEASKAGDRSAICAVLDRAGQSALGNVGIALTRPQAMALRDDVAALGTPDAERMTALLDAALAFRPRSGPERRAKRRG